MVGNAGCPLYACYQYEATQPPYGVEKEQKAIGNQTANKHSAASHVDTDSPMEV